MDWYTNPGVVQKDWSKENLQELRRKLITANHVLHNHGVVDAYGHISIRHPQKTEIYIMCGYMAPAIVTSSDDLIEYWVKDSSTVDPNAKKGYSERFIHGEVFRMFPSVNCVVHSHAEDVLPYVTSGVPLLPVFHMSGFLGDDVPVFDIGEMYEAGEQQDLLVRNANLGTGLASRFRIDAQSTSSDPEHNVVLMRRHGYTTHGADIETAVYRAIYTKINAKVQTDSMMLRQAFQASTGTQAYAKFNFEPLTEDMRTGCMKMNTGTQDKPWKLWVAEVEKSSLYINRG
ncbi:arad-like aldolase/epimerase [Rhizodiscina lignyota]|uniref:Arad-like aldolase/epimerase n=1 Tax=Rhizodiscina lignyota TaxID=1504668 RepID=A0A9P4INB1_9PEZI|nr:arad-like aldolase/epimerase [Rhizodiscina lignyota]